MRYRTIVADPPWEMPTGGPQSGFTPGAHTALPYQSMPWDTIASLPVRDVAAADCHLYLWTVNAHLEASYDLVRMWGFKPSQLLTWCKEPRGLGFGGAYVPTTEFVLFARRGRLAHKQRVDT